MEEKNGIKRTEAGMLVDLIENLEDGYKRELIGYTKCLYWKTETEKIIPTTTTNKCNKQARRKEVWSQ